MLQAIDGYSQPWKFKLFGKWIDTFVFKMIHHHHESEENLYNKMIEDKGGKLKPNLTTDHKSLMDGVAKGTDLAAKMVAGDEEAFEEFKPFWEKWMQECEGHFDSEEIEYPSQLKTLGITEEEEGKCVEKIIQSMGLDGNKLMLPAILYAMCLWGGKEKMDKFFETLPAPIKMFCNKCWIPHFWSDNLRVIQAIKSDDAEYVPDSPQCAICTIL